MKYYVTDTDTQLGITYYKSAQYRDSWSRNKKYAYAFSSKQVAQNIADRTQQYRAPYWKARMKTGIEAVQNRGEKMNNRFYNKGNLKDKKIVEALKQAAIQYENGEIIEVRDTLCEIVEAINDFENDTEE